MLKLDGSASELHFNPKEDKIAVALAKNPLIDEHIMFRKVHIVDLKTGKATNLNNPGKLGQLAWSPDGKKLAMITGADKHDPKEGRLWIHVAEKTHGSRQSRAERSPRNRNPCRVCCLERFGELTYIESSGV